MGHDLAHPVRTVKITGRMTITRHRHQWPIPAASFGGLNIDETATIKLLGVVFDKSMSFRNHLRSVAMRAAQRLGFLRKACRVLDNSGRLTAYTKGSSDPSWSTAPLHGVVQPPITCPNPDKIQHRALTLIGPGSGRRQPGTSPNH